MNDMWNGIMFVITAIVLLVGFALLAIELRNSQKRARKWES